MQRVCSVLLTLARRRNQQVARIQQQCESLVPVFNERLRRLWAATATRALGRGGITPVARATVRAGLRELRAGPDSEAAARSGRVRRPGRGRKRLTARDAQLAAALQRLTSGDPMSALRWTCRSAARWAQELRPAGRPVSVRTVNRLLPELGFSRPAHRQTLAGQQPPDRAGPCRHLARRGLAFQRLRQPVISVAGKRKELFGR